MFAGPLRALLHLLQLVDDFLLAGKHSGVVLRVDSLVVDRHIEDPATAANQLAVDSKLFLDFRRQTGGARKIVSNAAVVDSNFHIVLTRIAVTLSSPPRSFAVSISVWQAFSRSAGLSVTTRRISSSGTMPVRPSEHSR